MELFDLDEAFSSEKSRLAQITNKCGEEDLEYYIRYYISTVGLGVLLNFSYSLYIRECAEILGVSSKLPNNAHDAKHVLEYVFAHIVEFKKLNQELYDDDDQYM